ncbi:MAG TPA: HD domain-containing phosphohydrolase [Chitinivibrionales bacterium]|nr:HD domain-containing phosphohydrolase [Chitinivibrionales bacterium]
MQNEQEKMDAGKAEDIHLLVVDDERSICDIVGQFLRMKGYNVTCVGTAEAAIDFIKENAIDLVLSDIKMPGMSGVELLKWVREYNRSLPVVMTTGFPTLDTAIEALKLGAFDYLTKPFHLEEIAEKIKRALVNRQLEEENLLFSKLVSLHEVTKILASTYQLAELNHKVLDFSVKIAKADGGSLMFFDEAKHLIMAESTARHSPEFWENALFTGASKWVAENEEPMVMESGEPKAFREFPPLPDNIRSYIAFPLKTPQRTVGVLNLIRNREKNPFSNVDLEIINVLASQASISIENVRLYQNIRDNYLKTVRGFALAVEAKDRYTHGHSENVMKYTVVIAKHLGLSDAEIENVKYAGLLHDIGKIGVSELILNKPGRLTPSEFDEIKKHPSLGANIIADVPFLRPLVPMVFHHHEFYDGNGYPDGIKGEDIPFGARILSVADAYEAMTSDRPYRRSLSQQAALEILVAGKGKQFDPKMVDTFKEILQSGQQ